MKRGQKEGRHKKENRNKKFVFMMSQPLYFSIKVKSTLIYITS